MLRGNTWVTASDGENLLQYPWESLLLSICYSRARLRQLYYCDIATVPVKPASSNWSCYPWGYSPLLAGLLAWEKTEHLGKPHEMPFCPLVHAQDQTITESYFSIHNTITSISRNIGFLTNVIPSNQEKYPICYSSKLTPFPSQHGINLLCSRNPLNEFLIAAN